MDAIKERGFGWHAISFGIIGIVSLVLLLIFNDTIIHRIVYLTTVRLQWAFIPLLVWGTEGARIMFEKRSEIRKRAVEEQIAKEREKADEAAEKRILDILKKNKIDISDDIEKEILASKESA